MQTNMRLYLRYTGISLRSQMQYRASFVLLTLSQFLTTGFEFLGIWALFARFGNLRGWSFAEVGLLYGMVNIAFALSEGISRGFDLFSGMVKSGDFDRLLLRPRSTSFQVACQELQMLRVGRLLQGGLVLGWSMSSLHVSWGFDKIALLGFTILGGFCIFYGLFVLQATLAFWTVESLEIMNTVTYGGTETAQFPITIYNRWFRLFFTFVVPLACVNYLPASILLNRSNISDIAPIFRWLAPLVGPLFLIVSFRVWEFGVRHYRSTGS